MKSFLTFLKSGYYLGLIFLLTFTIWTFYEDTPPYAFNLYNMMGILFLILLGTLWFILFEDTTVTLPTTLAILFFINKSNMDFETVASFGFPYIGVGLFFLGPIVHLIRFKPRFRLNTFFWGFLLIGVSYLIPLLYLPFEISAIPVSMMGILYLLLYLFYANTLKGDLRYLFRILLGINLLLTFQVFFYLYQGYLQTPDLALIYRLFSGWNRNLGWANINDMCFYLALTFPSYLYFIFKHPKNPIFWFMMWLPMMAVILSKSRGGLLGFSFCLLFCLIFLLIKGNKTLIKNAMFFVVVSGMIIYFSQDVFIVWWEFFTDSLGDDLNQFSSGRIEIYQIGFDVFKTYPLFGGGWTSLINLRPDSRLFMYHSTLVQSLAAMGLFGLFALLVHYGQVFRFLLRYRTLEKSLFLIGYLASQIHGLIDNVQYAVPYSILMVLFLALFEKAELKT